MRFTTSMTTHYLLSESQVLTPAAVQEVSTICMSLSGIRNPLGPQWQLDTTRNPLGPQWQLDTTRGSHHPTATYTHRQAEPWWRASIWRSHRKVVIKQCSYHNNIIDIQNRLPYSKVAYPAIIVLFSCLMEVNHGVRTGPDYPFR